jgi:hypothetical protein
MRRRAAIALIHILGFGLTLSAAPQQGPLTKQEIISLLKQSAPQKVSQAEIVAEIEQRGVAFAADEKVIKELERAGGRSFLLDAVKRAARNVGRPEVDPKDFGEANAKGEATAKGPAGAEAPAPLPLIEQARRHALEYAGELPNFIVDQVVTRYIRTPETKNWKLDDTLEIELTYREGAGEQYRLVRINGSQAKRSYESLGGSTSTGEFGSMLAAVFHPQSKTEFKEAKKDTLNGRATVLYDFAVKKANSKSLIEDKESGQKTVAAYSGSVWIDAETKMVLRIESANEGMPQGFPVTLSEAAVEYDWVTIAGERHLLPIRAEVLLGRDSDRVYTRNVIEFKNYKKFEGKIKLPEN